MVSKVKRIDTYWRCNNPPKYFYFWSWNAGMQHLPCYCVVHETWKSLQNSPDAIAWCKKISAQTTNIDKKYIQQMQSKGKAHAKNILVHLSNIASFQGVCDEHFGWLRDRIENRETTVLTQSSSSHKRMTGSPKWQQKWGWIVNFLAMSEFAHSRSMLGTSA